MIRSAMGITEQKYTNYLEPVRKRYSILYNRVGGRSH